MVARHDILERPESLRSPVLGSILFHSALAGVCIFLGTLPVSSPLRWGDPTSMGSGSVAVTAVATIPLPPRTGRENPLANDTPSQVPAPPAQVKPQPKPAVQDEPDAIPLKSRTSATSAGRNKPPLTGEYRIRKISSTVPVRPLR